MCKQAVHRRAEPTVSFPSTPFSWKSITSTLLLCPFTQQFSRVRDTLLILWIAGLRPSLLYPINSMLILVSNFWDASLTRGLSWISEVKSKVHCFCCRTFLRNLCRRHYHSELLLSQTKLYWSRLAIFREILDNVSASLSTLQVLYLMSKLKSVSSAT